MITNQGWALLAPDQFITIGHNQSTIWIRSEEHAVAYAAFEDDWSDEILVGYGIAEQEIVVRGKLRRLRIKSEGRVWLREAKIDQTKHRIDPDVFTTLDRPPPLSAEMLAVQQMMRRNEIERERHRSEIERMLYDNANAQAPKAASQDARVSETSEADGESDEDASSAEGADERGSDEDKEVPAARPAKHAGGKGTGKRKGTKDPTDR
jgi:hypothetical protein